MFGLCLGLVEEEDGVMELSDRECRGWSSKLEDSGLMAVWVARATGNLV